ncbi:MAG: glycosyltransferase family 4 protein [Candidatus Atribacteria bacterium]|nr:glycosyltransferase family 4 protein [Candidatus Atribacteria bacterium]
MSDSLETMQKVIYLAEHTRNTGYYPPHDMYPNFFTYPFAGRMGRIFKKYYPEWSVEVWRIDSSIDKFMESVIDDVKFKIYPAKGNRHIGIYSLAFIKDLVNLVPNTIINIQNIHTFFFYQVLAIAPKSVYITAQHHGDRSPYFGIKNYKGLKRVKAYIFLILEKLVINNISHFFLIDIEQIPYIKKSLKEIDGKYSITPIGIDFSNIKQLPRNEACKLLNIDPQKKYMFYLGKYYDLKQVDQLCHIYEQIKTINPDIKLLVAGGSPKDKFYSNIKACGAIDFGPVLNSEVYKLYSAADVYVSMAFREDNFGGVGLAMIEAMACNKPVVCKSLKNMPPKLRAKVGRMPMNENEMVENIFYVLEHKDQYKNGRKIVESLYDYSAIQEKTSRIYNQLLNFPPGKCKIKEEDY